VDFDSELPDSLEVVLRLVVATGVGMALGLNRDLQGKPTGMRTLGLVALGAAAISLSALSLDAFHGDTAALSRVVQGLVPGILTGIGFLGAGVVLRIPQQGDVQGLTTAATVWVTAALGVACALGAWLIVGVSTALALLLLIVATRAEPPAGMAAHGKASDGEAGGGGALKADPVPTKPEPDETQDPVPTQQHASEVPAPAVAAHRGGGAGALAVLLWAAVPLAAIAAALLL